jgi:hypothetical protein
MRDPMGNKIPKPGAAVAQPGLAGLLPNGGAPNGGPGLLGGMDLPLQGNGPMGPMPLGPNPGLARDPGPMGGASPLTGPAGGPMGGWQAFKAANGGGGSPQWEQFRAANGGANSDQWRQMKSQFQ